MLQQGHLGHLHHQFVGAPRCRKDVDIKWMAPVWKSKSAAETEVSREWRVDDLKLEL